jgi:hypothetical protein
MYTQNMYQYARILAVAAGSTTAPLGYEKLIAY